MKGKYLRKILDSECGIECGIGIFGVFECEFECGIPNSHSNLKFNFFWVQVTDP